jgi:hypothetical protein
MESIIPVGKTLSEDSTLLSEAAAGDVEFVVRSVAGLSNSVEFSLLGSTRSKGKNSWRISS